MNLGTRVVILDEKHYGQIGIVAGYIKFAGEYQWVIRIPVLGRELTFTSDQIKVITADRDIDILNLENLYRRYWAVRIEALLDCLEVVNRAGTVEQVRNLLVSYIDQYAGHAFENGLDALDMVEENEIVDSAKPF